MRKLIKITLTLTIIATAFISYVANEQQQQQQQQQQSDDDEILKSIRLPKTQNNKNKNARRNVTHESKAPSTQTNADTYQGGLPTLIVGKDIYTIEQMDVVYEFFSDLNQFHGKYTVTEFGLAALTARSHAMVYNDMLTHRYDSFTELKQSTGPYIDHEMCLRQLVHLNERADLLNKEKLDSKDLNLYHLLDTYGRVPPGMVSGSALWTGMYHDCLDLKIESPDGDLSTRYCVASIKQHSWPRGKPFDELIALKAGVCLPRACDSLRYKNKFELIQRLVEFNAREVDLDQATIEGLYCLPDEDSPMRMWWKSPKTLQAVLLMGSWIAILIYSTIKYERSKESTDNKADEEAPNSSSKFGLTNGFKLETGSGSKTNVVEPDRYFKVYKMLAITNNFKLLFDTTKASALLETGDKLKKSADQKEEKEKEEKNPTINDSSGKDSTKPKNQLVDLRCLEGIKVICMSYVIMGHVLMCLTSVISNGREMTAQSVSPAFFLANLMPAFAVNSFFTITGLLTCYLLFKQNQSHSFITSPLKWLAFIMYRYLRIMPMYVVVVFYCKYLSKFTGSGPMWDYGTSSLAHRRRCEEESWLWTILFGANFKPPLDHCIPSAWYLANDFQFFMVTPIFLAILHKSPAFGQKLLKFCILVGYLAGIVSILSTDISDMRPIARFMPHGFKTYVTFLSPSYTRPLYRIPAYLCGLLFGYRLHLYEQGKLEYRQKSAVKDNDNNNNNNNNIGSEENTSSAKRITKEPDWSDWFKQYGMKLSMLFVTYCAVAPVLGSLLPFNKFYAKLAVSLFMSTYHIIFALAIGFYILLATTGHGNKFVNDCLSASFWKPLARLSLCAVLINIEVVSYIIQTHKQQIYIDFFAQTALNLIGLVGTYLGAIVLCVMFEAPIRAALNYLLAYVIGKLAAGKRKTQ